MELLQLKYFFDSAKTESFAKTAEKYMVPASSVSASIKRLEQELGCHLFDRTSNRVILNENGKRLQQSLCIVFDELEQATDVLSHQVTDDRQINLLVTAIRGRITDYIIEFKEKYPNIKFNTVFNFDETDPEKYEIIIDVAENKDKYPDYEQFELCTHRIYFRASANHPLAGRSLTVKQLCNQPFVSMGDESHMEKILLQTCKRAGFTPNIVAESNDTLCYRKFVEAGVALGLGREYLSNDGQRHKMVNLDVVDFNERQTVCGYYKRSAAYGNIQNFIEFLKKKAF